MARALRDGAVLVPGGAIVLLVAGFQALYGPIDRNLEHCRRYSRDGLGEAGACEAGLSIEKLHYVNAAGFFGWWINAHVLRRQAQSAAPDRMFDRCVVPWLSRLESHRAAAIRAVAVRGVCGSHEGIHRHSGI